MLAISNNSAVAQPGVYLSGLLPVEERHLQLLDFLVQVGPDPGGTTAGPRVRLPVEDARVEVTAIAPGHVPLDQDIVFALVMDATRPMHVDDVVKNP